MRIIVYLAHMRLDALTIRLQTQGNPRLQSSEHKTARTGTKVDSSPFFETIDIAYTKGFD